MDYPLQLFTNLVLVLSLRKGTRRGKRALFSSARNERRIIYDLEEAVTEKQKEKGGRCFFASIEKLASLRVSFRSGNSLFGLGVL